MFWKQGQTDSMGHVECLCRSHVPAFCALAATPETVENWLCPRERLLVLLYACTSSQEFVNGAREKFTQKGRAIVLRHKQYLSSTQSGLLTKPVTVGHIRWSQLRSFHLQVNGGGTGTLMTAGQLFLNRHKRVVNYCAMAAVKVASASREDFNALLLLQWWTVCS